MGYSNPPPRTSTPPAPPRGTAGAPHHCSLGTAACYRLYMLTAALLMTSSHSERPTPKVSVLHMLHLCFARIRSLKLLSVTVSHMLVQYTVRCLRDVAIAIGVVALILAPRFGDTELDVHVIVIIAHLAIACYPYFSIGPGRCDYNRP